jgi:hypothetical protein
VVGEHEQGLRKLARGLIGARGAWWRLPTATSASPEGKSRPREQLELGARTVKGKEVQMTSLCPPDQVEQKKREEGVSVGSDHGGDDVAASGRLGPPWHKWGRTAKEGD